VRWSVSHRALLGVLAAGALAAGGALAGSGALSGGRAATDLGRATRGGSGGRGSDPAPPTSGPAVSVRVGARPLGRPLPGGFVGLSLEYPALEAYAGSPETGLDPVLVRLIANLAPHQRPVLRIGGNSADVTWWPQPGERPPRHALFALTPGWLRVAAALARRLDARLILDLNLKGGRPQAAAAEATAFTGALGTHLAALEIGNEPDLYPLFPWYRDHGHEVYARPSGYGLAAYLREFSRWRRALGHRAPIAGPAFATFDWSLGRFLAAQPHLALVTFHHYPLDACLTRTTARGYPTIRSLLSPSASSGFAALVGRAAAVAHAHGLPLRLDELNSAECSGKPGVSNTFAAALWMLDVLFALERAGVDGVNVHTFPGAAYAPFSLSRAGRTWSASVAPLYYGMLLFTRAFPPGARRLPVTASAAPVAAWATRGPGASTRVLLINPSPRRSYRILLRGLLPSGPARLQRLRAPSLSATAGVTLGGVAVTPGGRLPPTRSVLIAPRHGVLSIVLPAASAALVSLSG